MSSDCRRTEVPGENPGMHRDKMEKLHKKARVEIQSNHESCCCEVTVLLTAPLSYVYLLNQLALNDRPNVSLPNVLSGNVKLLG